jgi:hypothetical protein
LNSSDRSYELDQSYLAATRALAVSKTENHQNSKVGKIGSKRMDSLVVVVTASAKHNSSYCDALLLAKSVIVKERNQMKFQRQVRTSI